jgi:lysophospholipase L1-like esterase
MAQTPAAEIDPPRDVRPATTGAGWARGYLAVALPALLLAADTALAWARGWRASFRVDLLAVNLLAGWLVAATMLAALPAGRRFYARRWAQLTALVVSLCLGWFIGELAVGAALSRIGDPFHCWRPGMTMLHRPNPSIMRGVGPEATARFNARGVRGTDPPPRDKAYRVLCVGGSSTACSYLDDSKAWPQLLAQELHAADPQRDFWVGNVGMPGFRTTEHLQFVADSPLIDEMDYLVVQTGINDFVSCLLGPRPPSPLWTHSNIRQLARTLALRFSGDTLVEDTGGTVYNRRRAQRQTAEVDTAQPDLADCLQKYQRQLNELIDVCRRRNVRLAFTTQPVLWRADLDAENAALLWFGLLGDGRYLSIDQLRAGMDEYNKVLRGICEERGIGLVDLSELDGDPAMFYDDCHFTELGSKRVAEKIAAWFAAHPIDKRQEAAP